MLLPNNVKIFEHKKDIKVDRNILTLRKKGIHEFIVILRDDDSSHGQFFTECHLSIWIRIELKNITMD